jgi:aerobic carbon-monoxide dehydrogenase medium subunit
MHAFDYLAPATIGQALDALAEHRDEAKVLAGGQSLVPLLNYRLAKPRVVVDINALPLNGIGVAGDRLRIGALTRHATLEESAELARACPLLREAAVLIGNVRVRTLGTLGGSLAHADPAAELPMAMVALDARFDVAGHHGGRTIAARDFFTGYLTTALAPDELLVDVEAPVLRDTGWAVEELSRRAGDFAIVAVTALIRLDARGRVDDARMAFGGVGPTPVRVAAAEDLLLGAEPTPERLGEAADAARDALRPESDAFVSAAYRRLLAGVLARRALTRALARAMAADAAARPETG